MSRFKHVPKSIKIPIDFFDNENTLRLSPTGKMALWWLAIYQTKSPDGNIPDDDEALSVISRLNDKWVAFKHLIRKCLVEDPDRPNKLIIESIFKDRVSYEIVTEARTKNGKKGGLAKRKVKC